jgi:succinate-semialdehyde dehydrogenase/glutarate-semialdehyde dehydrogenase
VTDDTQAARPEHTVEVTPASTGLNFSVWTGDERRGRRVARLQAGTVNGNDACAAAWGSVDAPMEGMKASGLGRRYGEQGILKYTESQTIAVERVTRSEHPTESTPPATPASLPWA